MKASSLEKHTLSTQEGMFPELVQTLVMQVVRLGYLAAANSSTIRQNFLFPLHSPHILHSLTVTVSFIKLDNSCKCKYLRETESLLRVQLL